MEKAYSYIRFSTKGQVEGRSLTRQLERAQTYAAKANLLLQNTSFQDLGVSGFKGKNATEGALNSFIEAVKEGHIETGSWLLVESFDRMSRMPVEEALPLLMSIVNLGITLVTLEDEAVFRKGELNMTSLMMSLVKMERAHSESKRKSDLLSDVWRNKFLKAGEQPTKGSLPAWLRYNDDKTQILVDPEKAAVVKMIYKLCSDGMGVRAIVTMFNEEGIPPLGRNSKKWHISYITKVLNTRSALGEYHPYTTAYSGKPEPTGEVIKGYFPAIIQEADWLRAQAAIKLRKGKSTGAVRKGTNKNLFTGFIKCQCGSPMNFVSKGKKPNYRYYLVCSDARYSRGCTYVSQEYYDIQWTVLVALQELLKDYTDNAKDNEKEQQLEGEKAALESNMDNLLSDLELNGSSPFISKRIRKIETDIKEIEQSLLELRSSKAIATDTDDIRELTNDINEPFPRIRLHQFLKRRVDEVVVHQCKHRIDIALLDGRAIALRRETDSDVWTYNDGKSFIINRDKQSVGP